MIYHENVDAVSGPRVVPSDVVVGTTQKTRTETPPPLSLQKALTSQFPMVGSLIQIRHQSLHGYCDKPEYEVLLLKQHQ